MNNSCASKVQIKTNTMNSNNFSTFLAHQWKSLLLKVVLKIIRDELKSATGSEDKERKFFCSAGTDHFSFFTESNAHKVFIRWRNVLSKGKASLKMQNGWSSLLNKNKFLVAFKVLSFRIQFSSTIIVN